MKRIIAGFIAGIIVAVIFTMLSVPVLAYNVENILFNSTNISMNGSEIAKEGESFSLTDKLDVPYSITYISENGGGTTYLPIRKFAEIYNVDITWDGKENKIYIMNKSGGGNFKPEVVPEGYLPLTDNLSIRFYETNKHFTAYQVSYTGSTNKEQVKKDISENEEKYASLFLDHINKDKSHVFQSLIQVIFYYGDAELNNRICVFNYSNKNSSIEHFITHYND